MSFAYYYSATSKKENVPPKGHMFLSLETEFLDQSLVDFCIFLLDVL